MYVVTGGAGFIGSAFLSKLNAHGIDNILVVDSLKSTEKWKNLVKRRFADFIQKEDFLSLVAGDKLPASIKAIIHMGACSATTELNADYLMENNYRYTRALAQWCIKHDARFIYASSAATYGDGLAGYSDSVEELSALRPLNIYGYSKHIFDLWAHRFGHLNQMAGLKFFNVYGPNEYHKGDMSSVVLKAFHQIRETGAVKLFKSYKSDYADGEQLRDFVAVKDCLDVMWWLLENPQVNGLFNLGTGKSRSWNDLAKAVFSAMNTPPRINYVEMPEAIRDRYQYFTQARMEKLVAAGYTSPLRTLEEGVADYVTNYLSQEDPYL